MSRSDGEYVWFDHVTVAGAYLDVHCLIDGQRLPLPVMILHPDCTLRSPGDRGRLGVPRWWAMQHGLLAREGPPQR